MFKKNKNINRSVWNNKIKKNYGSNKLDNYQKRKGTNQIEVYNLDKKWTYKTAIGIANRIKQQ